METTVDKLEALFLKADSDLDFVSCKLEAELSAAASEETGKQLNPVKMLESVQSLRKEYEALVKQVRDLQTAQKETMEAIQEELKIACEKLQELEVKTGVPD